MGSSDFQTIEDQITAIAVPVVQGFGLELVRVEFRREQNGLILRVFIDREGGINIKDCEQVSQDLSTMLSLRGAEENIPGPYHLEVSSPGLDRALTQGNDFLRNIGKKIKIVFREPDGRKTQVAGVLKDYEKNRLTVVDEQGEKIIAADCLESARLWFDWKEDLKSRGKNEKRKKKDRQWKGKTIS